MEALLRVSRVCAIQPQHVYSRCLSHEQMGTLQLGGVRSLQTTGEELSGNPGRLARSVLATAGLEAPCGCSLRCVVPGAQEQGLWPVRAWCGWVWPPWWRPWAEGPSSGLARPCSGSVCIHGAQLMPRAGGSAQEGGPTPGGPAASLRPRVLVSACSQSPGHTVRASLTPPPSSPLRLGAGPAACTQSPWLTRGGLAVSLCPRGLLSEATLVLLPPPSISSSPSCHLALRAFQSSVWHWAAGGGPGGLVHSTPSLTAAARHSLVPQGPCTCCSRCSSPHPTTCSLASSQK